MQHCIHTSTYACTRMQTDIIAEIGVCTYLNTLNRPSVLFRGVISSLSYPKISHEIFFELVLFPGGIEG